MSPTTSYRPFHRLSTLYSTPYSFLRDCDCLIEACCVHKTQQETFSAIAPWLVVVWWSRGTHGARHKCAQHALVLTRARGARAPARRSRDGSPSLSGRAPPGSWRLAPMRAASPPPGYGKAHRAGYSSVLGRSTAAAARHQSEIVRHGRPETV